MLRGAVDVVDSPLMNGVTRLTDAYLPATSVSAQADTLNRESRCARCEKVGQTMPCASNRDGHV